MYSWLFHLSTPVEEINYAKREMVKNGQAKNGVQLYVSKERWKALTSHFDIIDRARQIRKVLGSEDPVLDHEIFPVLNVNRVIVADDIYWKLGRRHIFAFPNQNGEAFLVGDFLPITLSEALNNEQVQDGAVYENKESGAKHIHISEMKRILEEQGHVLSEEHQ